MKFFPSNGAPFYVPLSERARSKAYFMPERCLYCVDKLNACAEISLGDNYTDRDESELGSNSVIIRTEWGVDAWNMAKDSLEIRDIGIAHIQNAQVIERRLDNMYCGDLRHPEIDLNPGMPREKEAVAFAKTSKLDNYKDFSHYGKWINSWMTLEIARDEGRLTKDNYRTVLEEMKKYIKTYNFDAIWIDS